MIMTILLVIEMMRYDDDDDDDEDDYDDNDDNVYSAFEMIRYNDD